MTVGLFEGALCLDMLGCLRGKPIGTEIGSNENSQSRVIWCRSGRTTAVLKGNRWELEELICVLLSGFGVAASAQWINGN